MIANNEKSDFTCKFCTEFLDYPICNVYGDNINCEGRKKDRGKCPVWR